MSDPDGFDVVTICGPAELGAYITDAVRRLTLGGHMVFAPAIIDRRAVTTAEAAMLERLHRAKIDRSDTVYAVNPHGVLDDVTRAHVDYAAAKGKRILSYSDMT